MRLGAIVAAICLIYDATACAQQVIFVCADGAGASDGSSWHNAFPSLGEALQIASFGDQIWVCAGTYSPGTGRADTFSLRDGVEVYGGLAGYEAPGFDMAARDLSANETVLSGDIGSAGPMDNSFHVVSAANVGTW